ncbi:hypothetical protein [Microvirga sesbaniae]|uniref:hypothetical protein n=1 Tax=Microvirga sesbaniae TaxID=681392 RepID=UPI0021C7891D|nr:hypothetical protein [Microvirga sp. HBU67692]
MPHPRPNKAAEYWWKAATLLAIAEGAANRETKLQLIKAAQHLEVLAADEERLQASPKPLLRG